MQTIGYSGYIFTPEQLDTTIIENLLISHRIIILLGYLLLVQSGNTA
jgi:hypothetical protein